MLDERIEELMEEGLTDQQILSRLTGNVDSNIENFQEYSDQQDKKITGVDNESLIDDSIEDDFKKNFNTINEQMREDNLKREIEDRKLLKKHGYDEDLASNVQG